MEFRSLWHSVRTNGSVWQLQRKNKTKQSLVTKLTSWAQDALWTVGFSSLKKLFQWYRCKVGIWVDYWLLLINEQSMNANVSIPGTLKMILRWNLELAKGRFTHAPAYKFKLLTTLINLTCQMKRFLWIYFTHPSGKESRENACTEEAFKNNSLDESCTYHVYIWTITFYFTAS